MIYLLLLLAAAAAAATSWARHVTACDLADQLRETCHDDAADLIDPRTRQDQT